MLYQIFNHFTDLPDNNDLLLMILIAKIDKFLFLLAVCNLFKNLLAY